jgi:chemotaxis protein histidine kinase CheA
MGFFLEEAKEHLDTIEKGLLDLRNTLQDPESINELFRAAHSVKGGAAMLGFGGIQTVAHRMEDCFKILKEDPPDDISEDTESLFFKGFDTLKDLLDRLESAEGLREEEAESAAKEAEPLFGELQKHLENIVGSDVAAAALDKSNQGGSSAPSSESAAPPETEAAPTPAFVVPVVDVLKQMLHIFRQEETPGTRKQLQAHCDRLLELGEETETWQTLVRTARRAIAYPDNSYVALAPPIIKELKAAAEQVDAKQASDIAPSDALQELAGSPDSSMEEICLPPDVETATQVLRQGKPRPWLVKLVKTLAAQLKS